MLTANDELDQVFDKYAITLVHNRPRTEASNVNTINSPSLLDLSAPNEIVSSNNNLTVTETECNNRTPVPSQTDMDILGDIFNSLGTNSRPLLAPDTPPLLPDMSIMQPVTIAASNKTGQLLITRSTRWIVSENKFINH